MSNIDNIEDYQSEYPDAYKDPKLITRRDGLNKLEIYLTVEEIAKIIVHLDDSDQALLFSKMAEFAQFSVPIQLAAVSVNESLTGEGRQLMELIGQYAEP